MAKTVMQTQRPPSSHRETVERVALISPAQPRSRIASILEREDLLYEAFESTAAAPTLSSEYRPTLILLWAAESGTGLLESLEPITQGFPAVPLMLVCPS